MKVKIILAVAALIVVGAQIYHTVSQQDAAPAPAAVQTPETSAPTPVAAAAGGTAPAEEPVAAATETAAPAARIPAPVPPPAPAAVNGIRISVGGAEAQAVQLTAGVNGWVFSSMSAGPVDSEKIARFLDSLLLSSRLPIPLNAGPAVTGLGEDGGVTVELALAEGGNYTVRVGLRPDGDFHSTFAAFGVEPPVVLQADLRGPLGLWKNLAGEVPQAEAWLLTRPFRFEPAEVVKVAARYPDHAIAFERADGGGWKTSGYAPGGEHSGAAVEAWLMDLSTFTVTGVTDAPGAAGSAPTATAAVKLTLSMADGGSREMSVFPDPDGERLRAALDAYPGLEFTLPGWRYGKYFLRMAELFPKAAPGFAVTDIRLIDLRHANESAKIARLDGEWRLVGLPYALRPERIERLARLAAALAPEDYADPSLTPQLAGGGGPVLEIVLVDGTMRQYRLAGRHPLFAWRYVTVDGAGVLSIPAVAAAALFPAFGEILDLGAVFPGLDARSLTEVQLIRTDDGARLLSLRREDGVWTAGNERGEVELTETETRAIASALPEWRAADFFEADGAASGGTEGMMRLRLTGAGGVERGITLLTPQGRDIPYLADGERAFLLRRSDFFTWLGAVRGLGRRIDAAAEEEAEAEATEATQAEVAPAEETPTPEQGAQPDAPAAEDPATEDPATEDPATATETPASVPADKEPETNQPEQTGTAQPVVNPAAEPTASDPAGQADTAAEPEQSAEANTAQIQEPQPEAEPERRETREPQNAEDDEPER